MTASESILNAASGDTAPGTLSEAATTDNDILIALNKLDPANDDHWTTTGKPAMDAVNALLPAAITRARLDEVAPDFSRPEAPAGEPTPAGGDDGAGGAGAVDGSEGTQSGVSELPYKDVSEGFAKFQEEVAAASQDRLAALEADIAFLRKQFGWPTKDA